MKRKNTFVEAKICKDEADNPDVNGRDDETGKGQKTMSHCVR